MIDEKLQQLLKAASIESYIGDLPSTPDDVVSIVLYDGGYNTEYFGTGTIYSPVAKVLVRNHSFYTANTIATAVKDTLHRYHDDELLSVLVVGSPIYLGRDSQKLHTYQVVFNIKIKE